jgi:Cu-Zn family superoxide dismutase
MDRPRRGGAILAAGLLAAALGIGAAAARMAAPQRPQPPQEVSSGKSAEAAVTPGAYSARPAARAILVGPPGNTKFSGTVSFTQEGDHVRVVAAFAGVDRAGKHGFHIHENGECTHDPAGKHFTSAGGHFNPKGQPHACPDTLARHAGDLGNVDIQADGSGHVETTTTLLSLHGRTSVVGKAVILHEGEDDCKTQPTGNAGGRFACGVVKLIEVGAKPD